MSRPLASDHEQRRQALRIDQSFIVQAPAGSGKTELLTDRILALLPTVKEPEEIVAITFTRKAAAEMHARVLDKLRDPGRFSAATQALAAAAQAQDQQRGWNLLQHPARLSILTIDALCARIARQLPYLARLGGGFATSDSPELLYEEAASRTLADLESQDGHQPALAVLLEHLDNDLGQARQLLADMLARRDQWAPLLGSQHQRSRLENALNLAIVGELWPLCSDLPPARTTALLAVARYAGQAMAEAGKADPYQAFHKLGRAPLPETGDIPAWRALCNLLLTSGDEVRSERGLDARCGFPAKVKATATHKEVLAQLLTTLRATPGADLRLRQLRELPEPHYSDQQWQVLDALFSVLRVALAYLWLVFQERASIDFSEVAIRALDALGAADEPSDVLLALDHRIRHLLVDEFQDTSYTQIQLLERLTAGWEAGDGRSLFLVGDPMQSIYRFRKAEVSLFLEVRRQGIANLRLQPLTLTDNFRSQAGIIDWANTTFAQILPERDDPVGGAIRYSPSTASHPPLDGAAVQYHWHADTDTEATAIATTVAAALATRQGVAILGRSRSHLAAVSAALKLHGIPFRAVDQEALSEQSWVIDLVQLLRALLQPMDRLAWLCVLRAPWCGLTLADLDLLCGDEQQQPLLKLLQERLHQLSTDGRQRAEHVLRVVDLAWRGRERQPPAVWLESVWLALGGPATLPHAAAADDIRNTLNWLEQRPWPLDLDRLDGDLQRLFAAPDSRPEAAQVQLMTMHKAKGLQFDVVILPALGRGTRADEQKLLLFEESGRQLLLAPMRRRDQQDDDYLYQWLAAKEKARADHESARLLYVAATRAKQRLHLFAVRQTDAEGAWKAPPARSLLALLLPVLDNTPPPQALDLSTGLAPGSTSAPLLRLPLAQLPPAIDWPLPATGHTDIDYQPLPLPAAIGTVTHAWLEQFGREGSEVWLERELEALLPTIRWQLRSAGVVDAQLDSAAAAVLRALGNTLADVHGRWLLSAGHREAHCEWRFTTREAGGIAHHIIDRSFIDAEGCRWIIDYKTSQPGAQQELEAFLGRERDNYREQLQRYRGLFGEESRVQLALYFPLLPLLLRL